MGLFANAATVAAPAAKGRAAEVETVAVKGLQRYAALQAAIKSLTALAAVEEATVKESMRDRFIAVGVETEKRPQNFKGVDGKAEGSCQLKIRTSASALSAEDQALLTAHDIPFESNIKTREAFMINPAYTNNMTLLAKVEEALADVDLPEDFMMKQEEVSTKIVSEASIDAVFKKAEADIKALLPVVTTLAVLPKIKGDFWSIIDSITNPVEVKAEAKAA